LFRKSRNECFLDFEYFLYYALIKRLFKKSIQIKHHFDFDAKTKSYLHEISSCHRLNIIITVHTGFSFLTKLVSDSEREVIVISKDHNILDTFSYSGVSKKIRLINTDINTLMKLKTFLELPVSVVCCIDEKADDRRYNKLRLNLIKFALRFNIPLYFYKDSIDSQARIMQQIIKADLKKSAQQLMQLFIKFINANLLKKRQFHFL
jgi:hypothetical protein